MIHWGEETLPTHSLKTMTIKMDPISLLANGFSQEFIEYAMSDTRVIKAMIDCAHDFVNETIPIVDDEKALELASALWSRTELKVTD